MNLVISCFEQLDVKLNIFIRDDYFTYRDAIPLMFLKMANYTGVVKSWEECFAPTPLPPRLVILCTLYTEIIFPDNSQG